MANGSRYSSLPLSICVHNADLPGSRACPSRGAIGYAVTTRLMGAMALFAVDLAEVLAEVLEEDSGL